MGHDDQLPMVTGTMDALQRGLISQLAREMCEKRSTELARARESQHGSSFSGPEAIADPADGNHTESDQAYPPGGKEIGRGLGGNGASDQDDGKHDGNQDGNQGDGDHDASIEA